MQQNLLSERVSDATKLQVGDAYAIRAPRAKRSMPEMFERAAARYS